MLRYVLAATAVFMVPTTASAAELISNGGFENPTVPGSCCITSPPTPIPGWTVNFGNVNVVNGAFASSAGNLAYEGSQYLDLVGEGGTGSLSQSFATVAGHVYTLTLAYSHNLFSGLAAASGSVTVGSLADLLVHSGGSNSNLNWQTYTANFIAGAGTSSTLTFTNLTGAGNEGLFLDAVSIQQAVPEASTWAQLLIGFALVGGAMSARRRRGIAIPAAV